MTIFNAEPLRLFSRAVTEKLLCLCILLSSLALADPAETLQKTKPVPLTGKEIRQAFANVRDVAQVQDEARTGAVNTWCANGHFISRWRNDKASGVVTGTWRVKDDLRCITIQTGLVSRAGKESCNPIFRSDKKYYTYNSDGSVHGIHELFALSDASCEVGNG